MLSGKDYEQAVIAQLEYDHFLSIERLYTKIERAWWKEGRRNLFGFPKAPSWCRLYLALDRLSARGLIEEERTPAKGRGVLLRWRLME